MGTANENSVYDSITLAMTQTAVVSKAPNTAEQPAVSGMQTTGHDPQNCHWKKSQVRAARCRGDRSPPRLFSCHSLYGNWKRIGVIGIWQTLRMKSVEECVTWLDQESDIFTLEMVEGHSL